MITALKAANINIVIFDNTPAAESDLISLLEDDVVILGNHQNKGLSVAFNQSINYVRNNFNDVEGFLFFDQDSTLEPSSLKALVNEYIDLEKKAFPIGVLGALPVDVEGKPYWVRKAKTISSDINSEDFFQADFVISSFSLVPTRTFDKVGFFDEKLFIDLVDSEFSFRCTKYGLLNLVSKNVCFKHEIGDSRGYLFGRSFAISSPIRNYYQARNLILVGRDYNWQFYMISKVSKRFIQVLLSSFISGDFFKRFSYFFKGVKDGVMYKGGQIGE
jgi:rhamnosyltransferase